MPKQSPEKLKMLITLLFLSFERREKNLCHNYIFRIRNCKERFKVNFTFKNFLRLEKSLFQTNVSRYSHPAIHVLDASRSVVVVRKGDFLLIFLCVKFLIFLS